MTVDNRLIQVMVHNHYISISILNFPFRVRHYCGLYLLISSFRFSVFEPDFRAAVILGMFFS